MRDQLTRRIFELIHDSQASLKVTYINTKDNSAADNLSRRLIKSELTEWELHASSFKFIQQKSDAISQIDLFASGVNHKLPHFASWTPEKGAEIVDAFTVQWTDFIPFLNPPFSLWSQVLNKMCQDHTELAVGLIPILPNNPWFAHMLQMLVKLPVLMPRNTAHLMRLPWDKSKCHSMAKNLRYLLVHLSGKSSHEISQSLVRFQNRLQNLPGWSPPKRAIIKLLGTGFFSVTPTT